MSARFPIAIVGAGAVAQALGRLMLLEGAPVVALAGRSRSRTAQAAAFVGASVQPVACADVPQRAARVLIAVSDNAVPFVADALAAGGMRSGVALHTCGARGPDALAALQRRDVACGVLHPLQTVVSPEQGVKALRGISFAVAGDAPAVEWAGEIVRSLEGRMLHVSVDRLSCYHAGAVMASNALVAVLDAAVVLMGRAGVGPDAALRALEPLSRSSLDNALARGTKAAVTGPVVRGDTTTVSAHLDALAGAPPAVDALYRAAARQLLELARQRGLAEASVRALESLLEPPSKSG